MRRPSGHEHAPGPHSPPCCRRRAVRSREPAPCGGGRSITANRSGSAQPRSKGPRGRRYHQGLWSRPVLRTLLGHAFRCRRQQGEAHRWRHFRPRVCRPPAGAEVRRCHALSRPQGVGLLPDQGSGRQDDGQAGRDAGCGRAERGRLYLWRQCGEVPEACSTPHSAAARFTRSLFRRG